MEGGMLSGYTTWDEEDEEDCQKPCPPDSPCEECDTYWKRMKREGFWKDGTGWTDKGIAEMMKHR